MRHEDTRDDPVFSPTRILGCFRQAVLQKQEDWYVDVDNAYPMTRGHMVHALVESARYPGALGVIREQQMWTMVDTKYGPQRFESRPDVVVVKGMTGNKISAKVIDYKSKTEISHDLTEAVSSHVAQVNMYRWLVTRELPRILNWDVEVDVDELEIEYCAMAKPRRFTSAGTLTTRGKMLTRSPKTYAELELQPIPIWSLEKVEQSIVRRIEQRLQPRMEGQLPPVLPEADQWMCDRCPVSQPCWGRWAKEAH